MTNPGQFTHEASPADYDHTFHAGNVGDVWKHCAIIAALEFAVQQHEKVLFVDLYAGRGRYQIADAGEWREGVGRVLALPRPCLSPLVDRYRDLVTDLGFSRDHLEYAGSPVIAQALIRGTDSIKCSETDHEAAAALRGHLVGSATVETRDALDQLRSLSLDSSYHPVVLIDPPWNKKGDWITIPQAIADFAARSPKATILCWYPIKSYTRVAQMIKQIRGEKIGGSALDLITFPLEHRRNRLNGSGLFMRNVESAVCAKMLSAATAIGEACAIFPGTFEVRATHWGE